MISTNLRKLKVHEGRFTIWTSQQQMILTDSLCFRCGLQSTCKTRRTIERDVRVNLVVNDCSDYQLPLKFRDPSGTDGKGWNTFRLSRVWADRAIVGRVAALVGVDEKKYGEAIITHVFVGEKVAMLQEHGSKNHAMLGRDDDILEVMLRAYGPRIYNNATDATVIYLDRI